MRFKDLQLSSRRPFAWGGEERNDHESGSDLVRAYAIHPSLCSRVSLEALAKLPLTGRVFRAEVVSRAGRDGLPGPERPDEGRCSPVSRVSPVYRVPPVPPVAGRFSPFPPDCSCLRIYPCSRAGRLHHEGHEAHEAASH